MINTNFSKNSPNLFFQRHFDKQINEYKNFYKKHLLKIKEREVILRQLYDLSIRFQKLSQKTTFISENDKSKLENETKNFLIKYFGSDIFELFNKKISKPLSKRKISNPENKLWLDLLSSFAQSIENIKEKNRKELIYKTNFLIFLNNCLLHYGLHPNIIKRNSDKYKRYNVVLEHYYKSKIKQIEYKILIKPNLLKTEFLTPYEKKLPIKINGKLIPFENIYQIKITSTLLLDDEIELFAIKNNFKWTKQLKNELDFINYCKDETDELCRNPYLIDEEKERFKNQNIYFVNPTRIDELRKIKNKDFDLIKLVQLCEELNKVSSTNNPISSTLLVRAIIDHIPPIFGYKKFSEVANNYSKGTFSFKKSMQNLDKSLRNIADNNVHSQVRKKEILPTKTQSDFSPELDLLLSEIVRILK